MKAFYLFIEAGTNRHTHTEFIKPYTVSIRPRFKFKNMYYKTTISIIPGVTTTYISNHDAGA